MLRWQREHIHKNLPQLQQLTNCHAQMIAHFKREDILSEIELQQLERKHHLDGAIDAAAKLYELLPKRKNVYEKFTKILKELNQSGAEQIFVNGYLSVEAVLELEVSFQGRTEKLQNIFPNFKDEEVQQILKDYKQEYLNLVLSEAKTLHSTEDTSVFEDSYISRTFTNRVKLNKESFQEKCDDIFVFAGKYKTKPDLDKLFGVLHPREALSSSGKKSPKGLYYLSSPGDWDRLRNFAKHPIHLIEYEHETETFILLETSKTTPVIGRAMRKMDRTNNKMFISENDFLENIDTVDNMDKHVCICDAPGMGKTLLLKSIANQIRIKFPDRVIVFKVLSKFIPKIKKLGPQIDELSNNQVLSLIFGSGDPFLRAILEKMILQKGTRLELFFDGFDEIHESHVNWAKLFFCTIKSWKKKNIRLFITSRGHVEQELIDTLGVCVYYMQPFSEKDQLQFLTSAWKPLLDENTHDALLLEKFTKACQNIFKANAAKDLIGIPMQCWLISKCYDESALEQALSDGTARH